MKSIQKHINKIFFGIMLAAICTGGASVIKVERLEVEVDSVKKEMSNNDKAHERIEKKVDLIIEKLIDNRNF